MLKTSVRLPVYHSPTPHLTIFGGIQVVRKKLLAFKKIPNGLPWPLQKDLLSLLIVVFNSTTSAWAPC